MHRHPLPACLILLFAATATAQAPSPLHLLGQWTTHVERVRETGPGEVTLTLLGLPPTVAVEPGDRLQIDADRDRLVTGAVVARDTRDAAATGRVHVRVRLDRPDLAKPLAAATPENDRALPPPGAARDTFVGAHAPRAVLTAAFEPEKGDRLADFVQVEAIDTGERVAPDAAPTRCRFVLRFSDALSPESAGNLRLYATAGAGDHEIAVRRRFLDERGTTIALEPSMGVLPFQAAMRDAQSVPYTLQIGTETASLRATSGAPLTTTEDLTTTAPLRLPIGIALDEPTNAVTSIVHRFRSQ